MQSRTADVDLGAATWRNGQNIRLINIRLEARFQPNIGFTLRRVLALSIRVPL